MTQRYQRGAKQVGRALMRGLNIISLISLVAYTSFFGFLLSPSGARADVGSVSITALNDLGGGQFQASGSWEPQGGQCWTPGQGGAFHYQIRLTDNGAPLTPNPMVAPAACNGDFTSDVDSANRGLGGAWPATGQPDATFTLAPGSHTICAELIHVNTQGGDVVATSSCWNQTIVVPGGTGTIVVQKQFDTDGDDQADVDGSTADPLLADYTFDVDGTPSNPAAQTTTSTGSLEFDVENGTYSVTEQLTPTNTQLVSASCVKATSAVGNVDLGQGTISDLTVGSDETVTCTFVNSMQPGTLTVTKNVVGQASPADWQIHVQQQGSEVASSPQAGSSTGTDYTLFPGSYTVFETDGPNDYTLTFGGDCDENGNVTVPTSGNAICSLTNTQDAPLCVSPLDFNHDDGTPGADGVLGLSDATQFTALYGANDLQADVNSNDVVDYGDYLCAKPYYGNAGPYSCALDCGEYTPVCGDTHVDTQREEQCDDGNVTDGDGCSSQCVIEEAPLATPDLTITKTDDQTTAVAGQVLHYTVTVTNSGNADATNVKVTDTLPANIIAVTNISDGGLQTGGSINWDSLTIPADTAKQLTYDATIDADLAPGSYTLTNTAELGCGSTISAAEIVCPFTGQETDETSVTVTSLQPTVTLVKTASSTAQAGGQLTYTLTWKVADATASNVVLVDPLPANTVFISASDSGTYSAATNSVTWLLGTKAPGNGAVTVTLGINSPLANGTNLLNIATISSSETRPMVAQAASLVTAVPALSLTKVADRVTANPGSTITYTITVKNNGSDAALNVALADVLPTGFTTLDGGATNFSTAIGTLAAGASSTLSYQATVDPNAAVGTYTNTATVTASNHASLSTSANVTIVAGEVLGVTTEATPEPQVLGAESLAETGTGVTDYLIVLFALIAMAVGTRLAQVSAPVESKR